MGDLYWCSNSAMATTAATLGVTTSAAIKTMLQISTPSTRDIKVVEWGITFDGAPNAIKCELVDTAAVPSTGLTAHLAAGVQPYGDPAAPASLMTLGTAATGWNASGAAEGTIVATRTGDCVYLSTNTYVKQWPLGREFAVAVSRFLRVRVTAAVAVNATCWIIWEE